MVNQVFDRGVFKILVKYSFIILTRKLFPKTARHSKISEMYLALVHISLKDGIPAGIHLFKVNIRNSRTGCKICLLFNM